MSSYRYRDKSGDLYRDPEHGRYLAAVGRKERYSRDNMRGAEVESEYREAAQVLGIRRSPTTLE